MNCFIYVISVATCKPNLYVFIDSEVNFRCLFYNNVVYTLAAKSFNILEIVCLGHKRLGDNFSLGALKKDLAALIYK
jgi:hypothetical protein